ncbi:MAG TPA: aldo/keto reductase [Flavisolibacter sp.]|nr:aldo/keto reductase [Flavisolibacter sp.]
MQYAQLGSSSLLISRIGFGCMSLEKENKLNKQILQQAISLGINYFDTADLYDKGMNEMIVGDALKNKRNEIILATKVGNKWREDGSGWDWNPTKNYIIQAAEQSLKRLQTDYIDLYQLHGGTLQDPTDETIEAFEILKQQGKIRFYGISSIRPNVIKTWIERSNITSVMMQYSLLDRRPEELFDLINKNKIGILARGTLAQGLLINKSARSVLDYSVEEVAKAKTAINKLSGQNRNAIQTAIQFALYHAEISSAIIGIRTMEQLEQAVIGLDRAVLNDNEFKMLNELLSAIFYKDNRI